LISERAAFCRSATSSTRYARAAKCVHDFPTGLVVPRRRRVVAGTVAGAALAIARWRASGRAVLCAVDRLYLSSRRRPHVPVVQGDNLLLECGLLARASAASSRSPLVILFRCVLFKLYFEVGVAKWQRRFTNGTTARDDGLLRDAPLPTGSAVGATHLPAAGTVSRCRAVLECELCDSVSAIAARRALRWRRRCVHRFSSYEHRHAELRFFCYLALALHVSCSSGQ